MPGALDNGSIAAALRVVGNHKLADEIEKGVQQQAVPSPAAPTPVQPTAPQQEVAPVEQVNAPPPIEQQSFRPSAGSRQLGNEVTQGQNRALDLASQTGSVDGKGGMGGEIKAEGLERQADLLGQLEQERKGRRENVVGRVDANRGQKDELERKMFEKLDAISAKEKNPPKDVMGMVMGIIGAAMTGGRGGQAMQMLGHAIGSKTDQWARELESDKADVNRMKGMFDLQNDDSNNELSQEDKIATLAVGQFDAALKKVEAETDSKLVKAAAAQTRNDLRMKYAAHQMDINARRQAAGSNDALWKLTTEQLSGLMAQGKLGKEGQAILTEKLKREQANRAGEAEIEGKIAGAEKARADAIKAANEAGQPGAKKLTEGEAKTDAVVAGALDSYMRLGQTLAGGGEMNRGAVRETWVPDVLTSQESLQQRADVTNLVRSILRVESGSNVPESEVEGKIAALGIDSGDPEIRAQGMRQLLQGFNALDRQGRIAAKESARPAQRATAPAPTTSGAAPAVQSVVVMYRPDGKPVQVQSQFVQQAAARGWTTEAPGQQQPALTSGVGLEQRVANERSAR